MLEASEPVNDDVARVPGAHKASRRGQTATDARDHNLRVTLEALRRNGPLSRLDLAGLTGLTVAGLANVLKKLIDNGLVFERSGGFGQRSTQFSLAPDGAFGIGFHQAGESLDVEVLDLGGQVRFQAQLHTGPGKGGLRAEQAALRAVAVALGPAHMGRVIGVGRVGGEPTPATFGAITGFHERDTVAAVLAERQFGTVLPNDSFVSLLIGDDIRAGLVIDGAVFAGVSGQAGRIGLMRTGEDGRLLRDVASTVPVQELLGPFDPKAPMPERLDEWIEGTVSHLTDAIIAISGLLAPAEIFVGGRLPDALLDELTRRLNWERAHRMTKPTDPKWLPRLRRATLGSVGVVRGAAVAPLVHALFPDPRHPRRSTLQDAG